MKHIFILAAAFAGLSAPAAFAHPHDKETAEPAKKTWPYFGEDDDEETAKSDIKDMPKAFQNMEKHFKKHADRMRNDMADATRKNSFPDFDGETLEDSADDLRAAAKALENMLAESDFLENMADMVIDLAENIEVDSDDDGLTLRFDGEKLGCLNIEREGKMNEVISIEGLGKNMDVEKDVIIKNGRKRTRIIIEMDTDEDVEIDVKPKD